MSDPNEPLREVVRRLSRPLEPQPTGVAPRLPQLEGVRAVVFDVYGTLLISGSGDISLTSGAAHGAAALEALHAIDPQPPTDVGGDQLVEQLHAAILAEHAASGSDYPEVDIRDIWQAVLDPHDEPLSEHQTARLATEYECRVNPVWPMPGCAETLAALRGAGLTLGIVSNAQFFTPIAMETLLSAEPEKRTPLADLGFERRRCVWSYEHRRAKPGRFLYERMAEALAVDRITPPEALYVGNDMRNDVAPAAAVGFRTALFAGDARSLRLRGGDPLVAGVEPDAVVTELPQILRILPLAGG